ncbi:hypothetical protein F4810DRAFT_660050 [Camillea tinctor]|nr:hypothetical protein F4810DRAFT_660050 [Camillea tinctor]
MARCSESVSTPKRRRILEVPDDGNPGTQTSPCRSRLVIFTKPHFPGEVINMILSFVLAQEKVFAHFKYEEQDLRFCNPGSTGLGGLAEVCRSSRDRIKALKNNLSEAAYLYLYNYADNLVRQLESSLDQIDVEIDGNMRTVDLALETDIVFLEGLPWKMSNMIQFPSMEYLEQSPQHKWLLNVKHPLVRLEELDAAISTIRQTDELSSGKRILWEGAMLSLLTNWASKMDRLKILVGPWDPNKTPEELRQIKLPFHHKISLTTVEDNSLTAEQREMICSVTSGLVDFSRRCRRRLWSWTRSVQGRMWLNSWDDYDAERGGKPPAWIWLGTDDGHRWLRIGYGPWWLRGELVREGMPSSHLFWLKKSQQGKAWLNTSDGSEWWRSHSHEPFLEGEPEKPQPFTKMPIACDDTIMIKTVFEFDFVTFLPSDVSETN